VSIPPLWLLFTSRYTDNNQSIRWPIWLSITVIPALTLLFVATNEQHNLIWTSITVHSINQFQLLAVSHGPWFWIHTVFSYALILVGSVMLLRAIWHSAAIYRGQIFFLSAGVLTPLVGNIIFITNLSPLPYLDITPLLFSLTGLLFIWGDYRARLLSVVPIARSQVIEKMRDGVVILNTQQQVADLNQAAAQVFHCSAPCVIGQPFAMLFMSWDKVSLPLINGPDSAIEMVDSPESNPRTFDMRVSALADQRGQCKGYLIVLRDITQRKQAETELYAQKALFEHLVAVARAGVAQPTLHATLRNLLNAAIMITGASHGSMMLLGEDGTPITSIFGGCRAQMMPDLERIPQMLQLDLAHWVAQARHAAIVADTQHDPRWRTQLDSPCNARSALAVPIPDQDRILGVITLSHTEPNHFAHDHIQLMQAAADQIRLALRNVQMWETQRELVDRAEAASRAKSTFIANVSHELRTPLNAILGYSQLLADEVEEIGRTDLAFSLNQITVAGKHLLDLINDVIDLSQIEAGQVELHVGPVDLVALLMNATNAVQDLAAKNHNTLSLYFPAEIGIVTTDLAKVRQVLLNLLSNACKFTSYGQITCTASLELIVEINAILKIEVCDTGIGMSPAQVDQLFTQFMQADNSTTRRHGGLGLGLALSQHLCRLMGGTISVVSAPLSGSAFTIQLPVTIIQA
ncbi:MAG: GAF domain-containing protein, partial [Oscillochloris sp.]|nr:GAF domain-containing protein [Oscillochloris sp.]